MSSEQTGSNGGWGGKSQALLIAGGLGLAGLGLAAGLMLRSPSTTDASAIRETAVAERSTVVASSNALKPKNNTTQRSAERAPLDTRQAALCTYCGVIEGVRPVQHKGDGSGVGAVAGGVLGAVVGNQMGGGNGKTAMTVLGALGGGVAGNEVEKRSKTTTVYEVQVRMEDGTLRTFTSASSPTPGAAVTVDGQGFHVVRNSSSNTPRTVRTMS